MRVARSQSPVSLAELDYMAYSGQSELVHGIFRSIDPAERPHYASKYVLHEVMNAGIQKLRKFLGASEEEAAQKEKEFLDGIVRLFLSHSNENRLYPRELFESMLDWADELLKLSLLNESLSLFDEALEVGINRFPDLQTRALKERADLVSARGHVKEAYSTLSSLAAKLYMVPDRNAIPDIMLRLGKSALLTGHADEHAAIMFRGLRQFYWSIDLRRSFVDQLQMIYRNTVGLLMHRKVRLADKFLFLVHRMYFASARFRFLQLIGVSPMMKLAVLGYVYLLNYLRAETTVQDDTLQRGNALAREVGGKLRKRVNGTSRSKRKDFLVTRAMGGIGDLLMMTPGLRALKHKFPNDTIHLAIPKRYFSIFSGNNDVELIDIEKLSLDHIQYRKWFNFTDCPASRTESRTVPHVKKTRIDIFASALGIGPFRRWRMDHRPRYFITEEEQLFQKKFWYTHRLAGKRVVGVQLHADETYRDYPHMESLVKTLAREMIVLLFDGKKIERGYPDTVIKVDSYSLRNAFALARACDAIVAPDSSFVHFAAAFDIPCIGLYGPIDGKVRTKHYPSCTYVDVRSDLRCVPCWRNESIPCKLTNMRGSVCMIDLDAMRVRATIHETLEQRRHHELSQ